MNTVSLKLHLQTPALVSPFIKASIFGLFCRGLDLAAERLEGRLVAQWSEALCRQFGCWGHEIYATAFFKTQTSHRFRLGSVLPHHRVVRNLSMEVTFFPLIVDRESRALYISHFVLQESCIFEKLCSMAKSKRSQK